ncbi:MAG TPA: lipopolysaccharide core biosynthesis protein [Pseudomonas sabulinigri]|uniref:Lipopolysaccharide core biosynthesis protein RfaZ n=1 Tax=marine sediment metagenome TaxID=412755 RepID=A0A0F9V433_9ZZZZ|nr:lipopolysaccharide core biosynthesis protein [Halopseudomonas sabulinigri]HEC50422.1 lipopolysaccharide core biosynthesis protein [Halopseudomonas sabulinigri]
MVFDSFEHNFQSRSGPVFILASGPSAAEFSLREFPSVPVIAMNGSILKCEAEAVRPSFYLCDDPSFIESRASLAEKGITQAESTAMTADCYDRMLTMVPECLSSRRLFLLSRVNRYKRRAIISDKRFAWSIRNDPHLHSYFSLLHAKPNRVGFSTNMSKGYFGSRTIPVAALQLAYHLGFSKVFLLGVDLNPSAGRFYEQGKDALPSTLDKDFDEYILPSFRLMAEKIVSPGKFEVFNMSDNSRLPPSIVPRLSLVDLRSLIHG